MRRLQGSPSKGSRLLAPVIHNPEVRGEVVPATDRTPLEHLGGRKLPTAVHALKSRSVHFHLPVGETSSPTVLTSRRLAWRARDSHTALRLAGKPAGLRVLHDLRRAESVEAKSGRSHPFFPVINSVNR